jgi:hypothetical protein
MLLLVDFLILKMEALCSFETSIPVQLSTWRNDPEYFNIQVAQCLWARKENEKTELRTGVHNKRGGWQWND